MTKRLSITVSDLTYDTYINDITGNRSEYIEKLIILGCNSLIYDKTTTEAKILKLIQENSNLQRELNNIKLQHNRIKSIRDEKRIKRDQQIAVIKGIQASGALYND